MSETHPRQVMLYVTETGHIPFLRWIETLPDRQARARIRIRLARASLGNFGDHRAVGSGVSELRIDYGPGYRVYLGQEGDTMVLLLCGGDKRSQTSDISAAQRYWQDYQRRKQHEPFNDSVS